MNLHDEEALLKRLKLKLGINKNLKRWGKMYATALAAQLQQREDQTFFDSVVEEMAREGMLTRESSERGALILVYREMEEPCRNS